MSGVLPRIISRAGSRDRATGRQCNGGGTCARRPLQWPAGYQHQSQVRRRPGACLPAPSMPCPHAEACAPSAWLSGLLDRRPCSKHRRRGPSRQASRQASRQSFQIQCDTREERGITPRCRRVHQSCLASGRADPAAPPAEPSQSRSGTQKGRVDQACMDAKPVPGVYAGCLREPQRLRGTADCGVGAAAAPHSRAASLTTVRPPVQRVRALPTVGRGGRVASKPAPCGRKPPGPRTQQNAETGTSEARQLL